MRLLIFISALVLFGVPRVADAESRASHPQAPQFDHLAFDFGTIREEEGKVTHAFRFRNDGSEPAVIVSATTSCGCTVPKYPRTPVAHAESADIEVTYDPADRPGRFDKVVTVLFADVAEPVRLRISGNVIPRPRTPEELYPVYIGYGLHAEDNFHAFSYIEHGKSIRTTIGLANLSNKSVRLSVRPCNPRSPLNVDCPAVLAPQERGVMTVSCDVPAGSDRYGTLTETLEMTVNGHLSDAAITVTGIVIDNRDPSPDGRAPKAATDKTFVKFGAVKHAEHSRSEYFVFSNEGAAPLHIRAIEGLMPHTELSLRAGDCLRAGERRRVEVRINPSRKEYGPVVERLRFITDDPERPVREVKLTMIVED